jgi:hypothetical protein
LLEGCFAIGQTYQIKIVPPNPGVSQFGGDPAAGAGGFVVTRGTGSHIYHHHIHSFQVPHRELIILLILCFYYYYSTRMHKELQKTSMSRALVNGVT